MKKIVAINCSPRSAWNTATLVREAARGAEKQGAEVELLDLYKLEKFTGCVSCFGCKLPENLGKCICRDGLAPVLEAIQNADGLIIGSPNYLGDMTAGFRALYERLIFQSLTYKTEFRSYNEKQIPVMLIMTSNAPEDFYAQILRLQFGKPLLLDQAKACAKGGADQRSGQLHGFYQSTFKQGIPADVFPLGEHLQGNLAAQG